MAFLRSPGRPDPLRSAGAGLALAISAVILLLTIAALAGCVTPPPGAGGAPRPQPVLDAAGRALGAPPAGLRPAAGSIAPGSAVVRFGVQALYLSVSFAPRLSVPNGSVGVGNRSNATVQFTAPNATVALSVPGIPGTNVSAAALGTRSVLVPGINDTVEGVPLQIYLEITGQVNATTFVGANGSGGGAAVVWSASGNLTVPFAATGAAGSEIEVGVTNLSYFLSVGVVAKGTVDGFPVSVNVLPPAPLPTAAGTPSTVVGLFEVTAPPPPPAPTPTPKGTPPSAPAPASHAASLPDWELALLVAGPVLAGGAIGVALWRRSAARGPAPSACPSCGHRIPRGASFCPGCARPVGPTTPPAAAPGGSSP